MPHLRSIGWKSPPARESGFPFSVPAIRTLTSLEFHPEVTLFVGENGSGKSTLLEGLATAAALPTAGAVEAGHDETLAGQRRLAKLLRLTWGKRTHQGFFLRSEDFFGFQKRVVQQQRDLQARIAQVDAEWDGASDAARGLAKGPAASELVDIYNRYGENPDGRSHGEAFLDFFGGRFRPNGLYLMDEPEAALSPQSQIGLLAMMLEQVTRKAQFIIATHSPILLSYPGAVIYSFDRPPVTRVEFGDLDHVRLTRDFLADPERFLRHLRPRNPTAG